mmetsp:Transcript_90130/g.280591  ORF Transcript_90130/g.280591 Transcript_90130/m.280591 type:complete len:231 (+) Transcript_90130:244-936(+)
MGSAAPDSNGAAALGAALSAMGSAAAAGARAVGSSHGPAHPGCVPCRAAIRPCQQVHLHPGAGQQDDVPAGPQVLPQHRAREAQELAHGGPLRGRAGGTGHVQQPVLHERAIPGHVLPARGHLHGQRPPARHDDDRLRRVRGAVPRGRAEHPHRGRDAGAEERLRRRRHGAGPAAGIRGVPGPGLRPAPGLADPRQRHVLPTGDHELPDGRAQADQDDRLDQGLREDGQA